MEDLGITEEEYDQLRRMMPPIIRRLNCQARIPAARRSDELELQSEEEEEEEEDHLEVDDDFVVDDVGPSTSKRMESDTPYEPSSPESTSVQLMPTKMTRARSRSIMSRKTPYQLRRTILTPRSSINKRRVRENASSSRTDSVITSRQSSSRFNVEIPSATSHHDGILTELSYISSKLNAIQSSIDSALTARAPSKSSSAKGKENMTLRSIRYFTAPMPVPQVMLPKLNAHATKSVTQINNLLNDVTKTSALENVGTSGGIIGHGFGNVVASTNPKLIPVGSSSMRDGNTMSPADTEALKLDGKPRTTGKRTVLRPPLAIVEISDSEVELQG